MECEREEGLVPLTERNFVCFFDRLQVEVGTVLARCSLPSMSPGLEGASAPGQEVPSAYKGTLVRRLLDEGELIAENGPRRGPCV